MPYSKYGGKNTFEMMESQGIDATEDVIQMLFLDVLDPCVYLREVPKDLRVAADQGE